MHLFHAPLPCTSSMHLFHEQHQQLKIGFLMSRHCLVSDVMIMMTTTPCRWRWWNMLWCDRYLMGIWYHIYHMIYDIWYMIYNMWYMICDMWYMIYDMWYMICDIWYMICDIWYVICDIWYMICDIWYVIYDIWYVIYDMWYVIYDIWYVIYDDELVGDVGSGELMMSFEIPGWNWENISRGLRSSSSILYTWLCITTT